MKPLANHRLVDGVEYSIQDKVVLRTKSNGNDRRRSSIGHIAEIRVLSHFNIYLRVFWFHAPDCEHLPHGRQPYHGRHELIATDQMGIDHAANITGRVRITRWDEEKSQQPPEGLYWRQRYNHYRREFSVSAQCLYLHFHELISPQQLRTLCICVQPLNPEDEAITCIRCRFRMHPGCLITAHGHENLGKSADPAHQDVYFRPNLRKGEIIRIQLLRPGHNGNTVYRLLVTDLSTRLPTVSEEDAKCLNCKEILYGPVWEDLLPDAPGIAEPLSPRLR